MIQSLRGFLLREWLPVTLAIVAGLICVAPHFLAWYAIRDVYQGIPFLYIDNENYYLGRIQEILDGHWLVASPFLYEYKSSIPLLFPLGEYFYIALYFLSGLALPHVLVLAKFLFPALLFFLIYVLIRNLVRAESPRLATLAGLAGAALSVVGFGLVDYHDVWAHFNQTLSSPLLSMWTRPVNPITGALLLFTFLILAWNIPRKSYMFAALIGLLLAAFIGYVFSFAIALTILGLMTCLALLFRDFSAAKKYMVVAGVGGCVVGMYALVAFTSLHEGSLARSGFLIGHAPLLNKIILLASTIVACVLLYAQRMHNVNIIREHARYASVWFALTLLVASFTVLNQQVITGVTIWPHHFVQYTIPLAFVSVIVVGTVLLGPHYPRITKMVLGVIFGIAMALGVWNATTYTILLDDFRRVQEYAPVFSWFNERAPKDCVILTADDGRARFTNFIPGFTHCNMYAMWDLVGSVPEERIKHNYFVRLRLIGVKPQDAERYMTEHQQQILASFYADWNELFGTGERPRIKGLIPGLAREYAEFAKQDMRDTFTKYRVDYVVDTETVETIDPMVLSELNARKVFEHTGISVYSL